MAFEFTESLTMTVPDVEHQLSNFTESHYRDSHALIVEIAAIHEGMTSNFNHYSAEQLEQALASWVAPYKKPIIKHHDPMEEALGRVIAARMEREPDGTPYTLLQAAITSPDAIAKILDERYLTGSVGGKAEEALCSVCGADWAKASMSSLPCRHRPGKTFKGKLAFRDMKGITFKEYSIVNIPADSESTIRTIKRPGEEVGVASESASLPVKLFSVNMDKEEIFELSESESQTNILEGLKKKDATSTYMLVKGAFLSAMAEEALRRDSDQEEFGVDNVEHEEEDILAVSEALSSDLAKQDEEATEEVSETEESTEEAAAEEATEEVAAEEEAADAEEEEAAEETSEEENVEEEAEVEASTEDEKTEESEENAEEAERPEGQEKDMADRSDKEKTDVTREASEEEATAEEDEKESSEVEEEEVAKEDELDGHTDNEGLESRVSELEKANATLLDENKRLKKLLKQNLAERVVDAKIRVGLVSESDRADKVTEHIERSAASLADSLRDLADVPAVTGGDTKESSVDTPEVPSMEEESAAISETGNSVVVDEDGHELSEEESDDRDPKQAFEDIFVDVMMGRKKI